MNKDKSRHEVRQPQRYRSSQVTLGRKAVGLTAPEKRHGLGRHPGRVLGAAAMIAAASSGLTMLGEHFYHEATAKTEATANSNIPEITPQQLATLELLSERTAAAQQVDQLNNHLNVWFFKQPQVLAEGQYGNPFLIQTNITYRPAEPKSSNPHAVVPVISEPVFAYGYIDTESPVDLRQMNGQNWLENTDQQLVVKPLNESSLLTSEGQFNWSLFTKGSLNSNGEMVINPSGHKAALVGFVQSQNPIPQA